MRFISVILGVALIATPLYSEEAPPPEEAVALPQPFSPNVAEVIVPVVPDRQDTEKRTDRFLKGGFCVVSVLFFLAAYIVVKSNEGQRTNR